MPKSFPRGPSVLVVRLNFDDQNGATSDMDIFVKYHGKGGYVG